MLNVERVKHMVKLAFYESKEGAEEIQISSQSKNAYVNKNTLWSILWMTAAYVVLAVFFYMAFIRVILGDMTRNQGILVFAVLGAGYLSLVVIYMIKVRIHYKKKHAKAHYRVKEFKKDLAELERMYEEESKHE